MENGAPGKIRTPDPLIRSQVLYPAELPVRHLVFQLKISLTRTLKPLNYLKRQAWDGGSKSLISPARQTLSESQFKHCFLRAEIA